LGCLAGLSGNMIRIPATFRYNQKDYSVGSKPLELDANSIGGEALDNPLTVLMFKYIAAPFSTKNYATVQQNLKHFLNVDLLQEASEENDDMEYNLAEYQRYIEDAWNSIQKMKTEEFLSNLRPFISSAKADLEQFDDLRQGMSEKANDSLMLDILTKLGQAWIMSAHTMTGEAGTKLQVAGEGKIPYGPAMEQISSKMETKKDKRGKDITTDSLKGTIHEGLKANDYKYIKLEVYETEINEYKSARWIKITVDFDKLFADLMSQQNMIKPYEKLGED